MAHADDYPYLTFLDTNGTEQSVVATGLVITFSDGQMNATDNNGKVTTISLSDLKKMYFSSATSAIDSTGTEEEAKDSEVLNSCSPHSPCKPRSACHRRIYRLCLS